MASRLLECRVCGGGGASAMPGTSSVVLTTEPGAGPCPSSWSLSPGPARTKGTALGHTELRDEHGPMDKDSPGPQRACVDPS